VKKPKDIFHRITLASRLGGRLNYHAIPDEGTKSGYEAFDRRAKTFLEAQQKKIPTKFQVYFDFFYDPRLNAIAFRHANYGFIGIAAGALSVVSHVFSYMLAHKYILTSIGNPKTERELPPSITRLSTDAELLGREYGIVMPRDEVRYQYYLHLVEIVFSFLLAHEYAHLGYGHVDYTRSAGHSLMMEAISKRSNSTANKIHQALEFDADSAAVRYCLNQLFSRIESSRPLTPIAWLRFYSTPRDALFNFGFAIFSLFRMFDERMKIENLLEYDHPIPPLREAYIVTRVAWFLRDIGKEQLEPLWLELVKDISTQVQLSFAQLMPTAPQEPGLIVAAKHPDAVAHVNNLIEELNKLRPDLDKLRSNPAFISRQ
jgi:hypothetical protein